MNTSVPRETELRLLGDLFRALVRRGVCVQMRDAIPGLTITRLDGTAADVIAYVVVNRRTGGFSWWRVDSFHSLRDVDGAADRITAFLAEPPMVAHERSRS
ncbi:hypothetical protein [Actinomadura sp. NTSP31]|uniref:hypothetical protein n=1 Tax=Actinomadura sp. NTSP31 TaxID=1735447 RepID=UPI0035BFD823